MKKPNLVRTLILAGSLLLQLSTLCSQSQSAAGGVDLSFDPGSGVNGTLNAIVVQPDGKVIIGGEFTMVKGLSRTNVARLNADGSGDTSFNPSAGGLDNIFAVALQSDGKVLIGGSGGFYSIVNGFSVCKKVSRLNADGSLDNSFNVGAEFYCLGAVYSLALQPNGKVLVGGLFATVNGPHGIVRLNSNGHLDNTFNPSGYNVAGWAYVSTVAWQPDGKVLLGGRDVLTRLNADGSDDVTFNAEIGGSQSVFSFALQPDGKILIGGAFSVINGANRNRIARLNADGSLDSTFNPGTGMNADARSVVLQSDGKVLIGGTFTNVNGTSRNRIARLNANGSLDGSFDSGTGADGIVRSVAIQPDGKALIGGEFTTMNGDLCTKIARLNADGSLDNGFYPGSGVDKSVSSLAVRPDGKVVIGGLFASVKDFARSRIARLNADGSGDGTFNPGAAVHGYINSVALHTDNKVLFAASYSGYTDPYYYEDYQVARLNSGGTLDNGFFFLPGPGADPYGGTFSSIVVQSDDKVMFGGSFNVVGSDGAGGGVLYPRPRITRLNTNGFYDNSFTFSDNPESSGSISALAVQPDGRVLVGGAFAIGTNYYTFARLNINGSLDNSFNPVTQVYGIVLSIRLQPDGKVLIGGSFTAVNGTNRNGIARLNANGSLDSSFNPGTGAYGVSSVALQQDGKVLIGGEFTDFNGATRNHVARLNANGSLDNSFNSGTGANGVVRTIALQSDGNVLIGGDFTTVNGVLRPYVARLYGDSVAPTLRMARSNAFVIVSWPVTGLNLQLQENMNISLTNAWSPVAQPGVTNAGQISVTVRTTVGRKFFRLKSQ